MGVWQITQGSGTVIGVVDGGLQYTHPDLQPNYHATLSWDFIDNDANGLTDTITIDGHFAHFTVEHVEVEFTAPHPYRGDLEITLTSPGGVVSHLATVRPNDAGGSFSSWHFGSVRHWGETAGGTWTLRVSDRAPADGGTWVSWTLRIFGTPSDGALPDLIVGTVSGPVSARSGAMIPVRVTAANQGQATTASFRLGLYLAADAALEPTSAVLLGTMTVPGVRADRPFSGTFHMTIPVGLAPGTYYLGAIADIEGSIPESDEANNARASSRLIELTN